MTEFDIVDSIDPKRAGGSDSSCSTSVIETVNGSHHFEIKGYSLAKGMGAGKYITSDTFTVGGYDWAIYFYPDGKNPEDSSVYVSVFIALASDGTDVRALFELTLLDQTFSGKDKVHSHFDRALESGPYTLKYKGSMWGYKRFFKRTNLEGSEYVKDDCLILKCTVGVVKSRMERPKQYTITVSPSDMGESFKQLLDNEMGCDIVFEVGDERFKAHKMILAARSPVFRAQFFGLIGNPNKDTVVVEDVEPSIFEALTNIVSHLAALQLSGLVERILPLSQMHAAENCLLKVCSSKLKWCVYPVESDDLLSVVMNTEGFSYLEKSCPSLLSELLETVASVDETPGLSSGKKRSSSSIFGLDLAADGVLADPPSPNGRRVRRRF
ncbi:hypothetical protein Cgig2_005727 [Carnegiea gigantea]|uniref:BTB/POZ and MATH domain-containing protein 3 n=1 Tax=Carnegiea gigantea TaxID=171969 RepID=A0A9Q1QIW6_9CARY|nr:hypothetical protein Cgig2_005727 [Carnegiea gigantea]